MKRLLLLSLCSLLGMASNAQTWNYIGPGAGSGYNASEVDIEITPNGQLFMAYIDTDNGGKATVRKWVNGSWQTVGAAGISSTSCFDLQLTLSGEYPVIAMKHLTTISSTTYEFIEMYSWNGASWTALGTGGYPWTYHSMDYSLRSNPAGTLFLTFYNRDYQTYDEGMITVNLSTYQQIGPIINEWDMDLYGVSSYVETGNDVKVAICELADMDYASEMRSLSGGVWDGPDFNYGDQLDKLKLEKGYGTATYCMFYKTSSPTLKFCAVNSSGTLGTETTIASSTAVADFDFDTYFDNAYVFYRNNSTCYFKQLTTTMSPTQTAITSGTALAPADATSLAAETYLGVNVIAFVSGGKCYVKELDEEANIEDNDLLQMCEGTSFNNGGDPAIYLLDPNFSHANITMTCTSQNAAILPQSSITVSPTGNYLEWLIGISNTNDVSSPTIVDLEWKLFENGTEIESTFIPITINPDPTISFNFTNTTICENAGIVNLVNKATPAGGTWSGTGVQNNMLNPGYNPISAQTNTALSYTKTNTYGCTATETTGISIVPAPVLSVTTTSADCNESNGGAAVAITEGQSPYDVYWSSGSTQSSVSNLASGQYYLSVTDDNGCLSTQPVLVGTTGITQSATVTNVACAGLANGGINLSISGGNGPFTYAWSNGAATQDINNLPAGPYEVSVTDQQGCVSTSSYTVMEPQALVVDELLIYPASCEEADGGATVSYLGGIPSYSYAWFDGTGTDLGITGNELTSAAAGTYSVQVTDDNGCTLSTLVLVSNSNGPVIAIDTIISASCSGDGAIELINLSGNAQDFSWSNGAITQNISNLAPGTYTVQATAQNGCSTVMSAEVGATPPIPVEICLVTVDTLTNTNLVVWEKPLTNGIESFNIYRETSQAGLYQLVGNVPYADESIYNDLVASPSVRSWRYKISSVDACGVESEISEHHKTIHLVINLGLGSDINLSWDSYEGFAFPEFVIKRHTDVDDWQTITTMPTNLFTYTDTPPTTDGLVYLVTVDPPATCTSTKNLAQDFNSARSNKDNRFHTAGPASLNELLAANMSVYPNPSAGTITLQNATSQPVTAAVFDAAGRLLTTITVPSGSIQTDLGFLADGMYQIVFTAKEARATQKLTITH